MVLMFMGDQNRIQCRRVFIRTPHTFKKLTTRQPRIHQACAVRELETTMLLPFEPLASTVIRIIP